MKMYCITIYNDHYEKIKNLGYIPVGLGEEIFLSNFKTDNTGKNISIKNPFYGEYTFHYWIWKNKINQINTDEWLGFCQYRKFWANNISKNEIKNMQDLSNNVIKEIPEKYNKFEVILGEPLFINKFKISKIIKKGLLKTLTRPKFLFDQNARNIEFHFDLMHGEGNLRKAIELLDHNDRKDFNYFVNTEVSFNPHNMFICKSKKILQDYYETVFPWLERCEKIYGFNLDSYGLKRIYGFLAERFLSYWFKKNSNYCTMPILFKDISKLD
tara:strand:+ start:138 stop:947 length:810 start_codon:yes stop_codon:yes gene_type:complete